MRARIWLGGLLAGSLVVLVSAYQLPAVLALQGQDEGEVQARGPIHEAFAQPMFQQDGPAPLIARRPPEPIDELPPDQKPGDEDVQWIPGYWAYDDEREGFLWVSGIWRVPPPNRQWVPGYWQEETEGCRWVTGYWALVTQTEIELLPPPPEPIEEAIPPQPSVDTAFIPGVWVFREGRFWWQGGQWVVLRPGWVWMPAGYCWTPAGHVFVQGWWDYDFHHRGLCFAPVHFRRAPVQYRPRHVLAPDVLLSALFVRVTTNHYHFGDYYDAGYARRGYAPWVDVRVRRTYADPLFAYYRWQNRSRPNWDRDLRAVYTARREDPKVRPARTVALQERSPAVQETRLVASLETFKTTTFKMTTVTKEQTQEIRKTTTQWRSVTQQRSKVETEAKRQAKPAKTGAEIAPVRIAAPKTLASPPPAKGVRSSPPEPQAPKIDFKKQAETKKSPKSEKNQPVPEPEKKKGTVPPEPEKKKVAPPEPEKKKGLPPEPEKKKIAPPEPEKKKVTPAPEPEKKKALPPEPETKKAPPPPEPEKKKASAPQEPKQKAPPEPEKKKGSPEPEKKKGSPAESKSKKDDSASTSTLQPMWPTDALVWTSAGPRILRMTGSRR